MTVSSTNLSVWRIAAGFAVFVVIVAPAAAQQASEAQRNAIRQACPADYQANCANVPAAGKAAFTCLQRNMANLSPPCQRAVKSVSGGAASHGTTSSDTAAAPSASAGSAQSPAPMPLREEMMLMRQSCGGDYRVFCSGVPLGGGRAIGCLRAHAGSLSPQCGEALSAARSGR